MVGLAGFEPATSPLSGVRSNQLSYRPKIRFSKQVTCVGVRAEQRFKTPI